jgi:hypothetical protein
MFLAVPVVAVVAASWRHVLRVFGTTTPSGTTPTDTAPADGPVVAADPGLAPAAEPG